MMTPSSAAPTTRLAALALTLAGTLLVFVSALADAIGLGDGDGFGWKQLIGLIVGLVLLLVGLAWWFQRSIGTVPDDPADFGE